MQALEGCVGRDQVKKRLTEPLCENLMATGFYDVKIVSNDQGEHAFVTAPAAIHKFVDTMVDDAFDLAKALVAALTYGIATSDPGRGRIMLPSVLLNKLVAHAFHSATTCSRPAREFTNAGFQPGTPGMTAFIGIGSAACCMCSLHTMRRIRGAASRGTWSGKRVPILRAKSSMKSMNERGVPSVA